MLYYCNLNMSKVNYPNTVLRWKLKYIKEKCRKWPKISNVPVTIKKRFAPVAWGYRGQNSSFNQI